MADIHESLRAYFAPSQLIHTLDIPERPAQYSPLPPWVNENLTNACHQAGITQLWTHQAHASESIYSRCHTALTTGTGSGKSLAAWLPILALLVNFKNNALSAHTLRSFHRPPRALYLCPTKALCADQYTHIQALARATDPRMCVSMLDGDTDRDTRHWARENADIILTNPDFLHHAILSHHHLWQHFLPSLSTIVLDEFHSYRGLFAAHVSLVMRRLRRLCTLKGADPTFVFLSATMTNAGDHAARFIGVKEKDVTVIDRDTSPRTASRLYLVQPREISSTKRPATPEEMEDLQSWGVTPQLRSATKEAAELTATLASQGFRLLTFVRSRQGVETVAALARKKADKKVAEKISSYRGGYLPEERRKLEKDLREGTLYALATTNALELGIDISGLDAVIMTGWPSTLASFWQQSGRAGRAGMSGVSIFIAQDNPLDHYIVHHPELLTGSPKNNASTETSPEALSQTLAHIVHFDPRHPSVLIPHLCAAASEAPLTHTDLPYFSLSSTEIFSLMEKEKMLIRRPSGWMWDTRISQQPHQAISLRGNALDIPIVEESSGTLLGTVAKNNADSTVYPGAIYTHLGSFYRVDSYDEESAFVHAIDEPPVRTYPNDEMDVSILASSMKEGDFSFGEVRVDTRVTSYDIHRAKDGSYMGTRMLHLPVRSLHTQAMWMEFTTSELTRCGLKTEEIPGALHALEHAAIGMLPLISSCDRWDIGGLSTASHSASGLPTIFVYDGNEGGAGFAERGFLQKKHWLEATRDVLLTCPCENGCPQCIQSPKCGNNNSPLSKSGAILLAQLVCEKLAH